MTSNFPDVFVKHKGRRPSQNNENNQESQDFARLSCDFSSSNSDSGLTRSDSGGLEDKDLLSRYDEEKTKRQRRKKGKDKEKKAIEDNQAVDPIRYKTKMCKNWQQFEKCPYGPRCLFAHGNKEMRSHTSNHNAVSAAAQTSSPERQFYVLGHFPSFMPLPYKNESDGSETEESGRSSGPTPEAVSETSSSSSFTNSASFTHSPYTLAEPLQEADLVTDHKADELMSVTARLNRQSHKESFQISKPIAENQPIVSSVVYIHPTPVFQVHYVIPTSMCTVPAPSYPIYDVPYQDTNEQGCYYYNSSEYEWQ